MTLCWEIPLLTSLFIGRRRPECTQRIKIIIQPVSRADPVECLGKHQMLSVGLRHHLQGYGIMDRIMVYGIHWKLGNVPPQDNLWIRAIANSIYPYKPTISLDICPEEHIASLDLELPKPNPVVGYDFCVVVPRMGIEEARKAFLTHVLARTLVEYKNEIVAFGREWSPDSFPFRELAFALVSITSGEAKFHSFPARGCNPRRCVRWDCDADHLFESPGWLDNDWAGPNAPLPEFGSMSHRAGQAPGASPSQTTYWLEDVLVTLTMVIDGEAITNAVAFGIDKGRTSFQVVILSLFKVAFAEVSCDSGKISVKVSRSVRLSPLRAEYCMSTHPRERPELKPGMPVQQQHGELLMQSNCMGTTRRLRQNFPGLAALVNFFEVAANRRAASNSIGTLPVELYDRILDFVDYDTLDERMRIVAGPFVRLHKYHKTRLLSFNFEDVQTGQVCPMMQVPQRFWTRECSWMPLIGSSQKVLMVDVAIQFESSMDVSAEEDSDD
ncbi:hypothetical protein PG987_004853 [Apiospora arundinis]